MLQPYLRSVYRDGGRGELVHGRPAYDCWGLTRIIRHEVFGLPLLPSHGAVSAHDKNAMTDVFDIESRQFKEGPPCPAAIATAWRHGLCIHVAVCIELNGRLGVLETRQKHGPAWMTVREFERRYPVVRYHH